MEIHRPERPIHSTTEFLLALTTITIGILIAMSLEGVVQWSHHRTLVREAKARLAEELRENRREADGFLKRVPAMKESNDRVINFIDALAQSKLPKGRSVELHSVYDMMSLAATSWNTAQGTGALAYMEYADAQKYAAAYALQAKVEQLQDRVLDKYITSLIRFGNPEKATAAQLQQWRQDVLLVSGYVDAQRQLTEQLIKEYDKTLNPAP